MCVQESVRQMLISYLHILMLFVTFENAEEEAKGFSSADESVFAVQSHERQPSEPRTVTQEPPKTQEQGQRGG